MKRLFCFLFPFLSCCKSITTDEYYGEFSGPIRTEWLDDREMIILQAVHYTDPNGRIWQAPRGAVIDGASIPQLFWSIIGGPFDKEYRSASVFHDVACRQRIGKWYEAHRMFYYAMRCSGVRELKAKIMFAAVYHYGPRWIDKLVSFSMNQPTLEEANKLVDYITMNNPSIEQIQSLHP